MTIKTVKMSTGHQVYLPQDILEAAGATDTRSFLIHAENGIIQLVPAELAEQALQEGLANLQDASLNKLTQAWENPDDEDWNQA